MERFISHEEKIPVRGDYDVIVAGGGVAGVAAAVSAARLGKRVLLVEKTVSLGGLATIGLINLFVPMCNGRGVQIIRGMAEELLRLSISKGYDTLPEVWRNGEPGFGKTGVRYLTKYSTPIFIMQLTEFVKEAGVDLLFDTVVSEPVMDGNRIKGVILDSKSGREYYSAKICVDTTGDADLLYRAGVPTVEGGNYVASLPTRYKTAPSISRRDALIMALASACTLLQSSYRSPLGIPSSSRRQTPRSIQFNRPRGAPVYPLEIISSFFTIIAP